MHYHRCPHNLCRWVNSLCRMVAVRTVPIYCPPTTVLPARRLVPIPSIRGVGTLGGRPTYRLIVPILSAQNRTATTPNERVLSN